MISNEEKLLNAIFKDASQETKSLKFSMNLNDVTVDVSIRRNKKSEVKSCGCKECKCGGKR